MKKLIVITLLALPLLFTTCSKGDKVESAFKEYVEQENIPNFNGIVSIQKEDSVPFDTEYTDISRMKFKADSVRNLLTQKIEDMATYYGGLSYSKKQQLATEYARIGAEYGEFCVNDIGKDDVFNIAKDAIDNISPHKEPLYIYHIITKIGTNNISFYGFACEDEIAFVKADDDSEAMRKYDKLSNLQKAMMNVLQTKMVPPTGLINDVDAFMKK